MPGIKALRKIQLGVETTPGTAVAATTIWRGPASGIEDLRETVFAQEDVGVIGGVDRTYVPKLGAQLSFGDTEATFEQLPYILLAGVDGSVSGVQDGAGSDYVWTFNFGTTSQKTPKTYTIEAGDDQAVEEMEYSFVTEFSLSGAADEALKVGATWLGRQVSTSTFTGSLSVPSVEEILFNKGKLYIDDSGGTIGSTQKSNTLISASLSITTGFQPVVAADGELYFSTVKQIAPEATLELTFEHDGTATAEKSAWRSQTTRLVRLIFEGSAVGTPGTTYSNLTLIVDLAGRWEKFAALADSDGNDVVTGTLRARYSSTDSLFGQVVVVNELSSLP